MTDTQSEYLRSFDDDANDEFVVDWREMAARNEIAAYAQRALDEVSGDVQAIIAFLAAARALLGEAREALADDPPYLTIAQVAQRGDLRARIDAALAKGAGAGE